MAIIKFQRSRLILRTKEQKNFGMGEVKFHMETPYEGK